MKNPSCIAIVLLVTALASGCGRPCPIEDDAREVVGADAEDCGWIDDDPTESWNCAVSAYTEARPFFVKEATSAGDSGHETALVFDGSSTRYVRHFVPECLTEGQECEEVTVTEPEDFV